MGKTLLSLFSEFEKGELCQLYIYPSVPDVDKCESYYRITDKDVLKGCLAFRVKGRIQNPNLENHELFEKPTDEMRYRNPKNKGALRSLGRDLMWKIAPWFNRELKLWIEEQKPTYIFLAPGKAKFIYDVALKISGKYHLPIVTYFADDYYFVNNPKKVMEQAQLELLKRKMKHLADASTHFFSISEEMHCLYEREFNVPTSTIMTGASISFASEPNIMSHPTVITYMGNIQCGRWRSIADVGRALDKINRRRGTSYELHLYTGEKDPKILSAFNGISAIQMCGYVSGEKYWKAFNSAEMFLHVEAFDFESIDVVRHSISTKIADCLASGRPLLAYGPSGIASIDYLKQNDCAYVVTDFDELDQGLQDSLGGTVDWMHIVEQALKMAKKNHCAKKSSIMLKEILCK